MVETRLNRYNNLNEEQIKRKLEIYEREGFHFTDAKNKEECEISFPDELNKNKIKGQDLIKYVKKINLEKLNQEQVKILKGLDFLCLNFSLKRIHN